MIPMNKCIFEGRLVKDPQAFNLDDEKKVHCEFTLAVNRGHKKGAGADYIRCVVWGAYARTQLQYLNKGKAVRVEGRLVTNSVSHTDEETGAVTWNNYWEIQCDHVIYGMDAKYQQSDKAPAEDAGETAAASSEVVVEDIVGAVMAQLEANQKAQAAKVQSEGM